MERCLRGLVKLLVTTRAFLKASETDSTALDTVKDALL